MVPSFLFQIPISDLLNLKPLTSNLLSSREIPSIAECSREIPSIAECSREIPCVPERYRRFHFIKTKRLSDGFMLIG